MATDVHAYIDAHQPETLKDYIDLLSIPSISALREHDGDTRRAAEFVADMLRRAKLEHVEVIQTQGAPLVYGDWLHADGKPTVLLYAHYDVQPVDPIGEWQTQPFAPTIKGETIYARGATDDKNQLVATVHAVGALLAAQGEAPVNVRFLLEGEEESGGEAIEAFVKEHPERIPADVVIVADGGMEAKGQPSIHYGCRGILYTEIVAKGAKRDLHSGSFGGNAANPLFALAQIVTGLKDANGHITIPGLYELMQAPTAEERSTWDRQAGKIHGQEIEHETGEPPIGEPEYSVTERAWARPTLEVHGFIGGFQEEGSKTVIPAEARVKVSLRLVPGQTPENVLPLLQKRVAELTPQGIRAEVKVISGGLAFYTDLNSPAIQAARKAISAEFGVETWTSRAGGSIPISALFQEKLGADVFVMGFGLASDWAHAANEHTDLPTFYKSVHAFARVLNELGANAASA